MSTTATDRRDRIIATLRSHESDLRRAGIRRLSLYGSVARGDARPDSDLDLVAEFDPAARIGLFGLGALERWVGKLVGVKVDLVAEPIEMERLRAAIDRDRHRAF